MNIPQNPLEKELNQEIDDFMNVLITAAGHLASAEFPYKNFRHTVLQEGNKLKRSTARKLVDFEVKYTITRDQFRQQILEEAQANKEEK